MTTSDAREPRPLTARSLSHVLGTWPRVLAMGEPVHNEGDLLALRNALFADLVNEGYLTIALEISSTAALVVDAYVRHGRGTLEDAMERGFSHGWGHLDANRALVTWLRDTNESLAPHERIRFAGIDGPMEITGAESPRHHLGSLHSLLVTALGADSVPFPRRHIDSLAGDDAEWTCEAAMLDPEQSNGRSPAAVELRILADELRALLEENSPEILARSGREALWEGNMFARTAVGLLRYHFSMADPSDRRMSRLLGARDALMAGNLTSLACEGPVFVYAHNSHLQRQRSSMTMWNGQVEWWGAGAHASAILGEDFRFVATAVGAIPHRGVGLPEKGTLEWGLSSVPGETSLVDPRTLDDFAGSRPRESPWYGYAPLDPAHLADTDAVAFVRTLRERT